MTDFLAAADERVLILDGAFGTWVQAQDLGPEDFGGPALEGCNEHLVLTRPDLIRRMHDEYFAVGVDAVETATFGAFALVLAEYGLAGVTYELNVAAARIAKEAAEAAEHAGTPPVGGRLDRTGHPAALTRRDHLRRAPHGLPGAGRRAHRGRRRRAARRDGLRPAPGQGRAHRVPARDGRRRPRRSR